MIAADGRIWLVAWRPDIALALGASVPLARASCGFAGASDGWTDLRDGQVFDRIVEAYKRYVAQGVRSELVIWKFNHKVRTIRTDQRLRIEVGAPAELHWTRDIWTTVQHDPLVEVAPRAGVYAFVFPPSSFTVGRALIFTFYWPEVDRWESRDFVVAVT